MYIERKDYNKVITIKLVVPSYCNAKCVFCYMNDYKEMCHDKKIFLDNFIISLNSVIKGIGNKNPISLDITGNEPTFDIKLLSTILGMLKSYNIKSKVQRVTITTNGYNLKELIPCMVGVIDYVNISIHDFDKTRRENIMKCKSLTDSEYQDIVRSLKQNGITTSAVSVLYKPINDFEDFMNKFIQWCKDIGFIGLRFRNDVFWKDTEFEDYMNIALNDSQFNILVHEETSDSHWCRLRRYDKFRVFFLKGVLDTSILTKGIEYVIADDGKCYCDFYKKIKLEDYKFELGKIYDCVELKEKTNE